MKLHLYFLLAFGTLLGDLKPWPLPRIHTLGDSHSRGISVSKARRYTIRSFNFIYEREGDDYRVPVGVRSIGPRLMYTFGIRGCERFWFSGIKSGEIVVFSFGSIDASFHLWKFINDKEDMIFRIRNMVDAYLVKLREYQSEYHFVPIVYGPVPPASQGYYEDHYTDYENMQGYLAQQQRLEITKHLREILIEKCTIEGITYFDIIDETSDAEGLVRSDYTHDGMHIHTEKSHQIMRNKLCDLIWEHYYLEEPAEY